MSNVESDTPLKPVASRRSAWHRIAVCVSVALFVLLTHSSPSPAAQSVDQLRSKIDATKDPADQAKLYKELGDQYRLQDKLEDAAAAYEKALSLGRDRFSADDRVRMAIYLSWADRLQESIHELRSVLTQDPKHLAARIHLARVLSWSGQLADSIQQAGIVLEQSPDNKEALLIKADALQWQGRFGEAIPIYQKLIDSNGDFDARIGLSYALLSSGNRTSAQENARLLKAANPRQERALKKLTDAIDKEVSPKADFRYNYYKDSDSNRLDRYAFLYNFWVGNYNLEVNFRHTDARDKTRDNRAEDLSFKAYTNIDEYLAVGAGVGLNQLGNGHNSHFATGHFRVDGKVWKGTTGASVTREVLSDTAELVEKRIRMTNVGLYFSQPLTERFSLYGGYNYKDFSDGNHANDFQMVSRYAIFLSPRVAIGHRFRFLDFHKQSGGGYFDPNNYISNRLFTSFSIEKEMFYTYLDLFVGHQTFRRNRFASDDFIHGGSGSIGVRPVPNLTLEVNAEGGTFAAGSASGFNYFIVGPRILFRF